MENISERETLSGFGYWVNYEKEVIDDLVLADYMAQTLSKSSGLIDWDYGLMKRLPMLAGKDKANTFLIVKNYLLDSFGNLNEGHKSWGLYNDGIKEY